MAERMNEKKALAVGVDKETEQRKKKEWRKPTLEDVSGRVMAQPYIRFT